ncbi:hypothetical protein RAS1_08280 [Phycisphaerae bacterium RAS1]|nr:hypothetical protein RAS1_08280 [Phycisphaerae bacterium RAS1]
MNREPNNADRAAWAENALEVFTVETYCGRYPRNLERDDLETAVGDLIADLLHYANRKGLDTDEILRSASFHFEAELAEEAQNV